MVKIYKTRYGCNTCFKKIIPSQHLIAWINEVIETPFALHLLYNYCPKYIHYGNRWERKIKFASNYNKKTGC